MSPIQEDVPRTRMNAHVQRVLRGLRTSAERDLRLDTLGAVLETYAASPLVAHGERPWPREVRR